MSVAGAVGPHCASCLLPPHRRALILCFVRSRSFEVFCLVVNVSGACAVMLGTQYGLVYCVGDTVRVILLLILCVNYKSSARRRHRWLHVKVCCAARCVRDGSRGTSMFLFLDKITYFTCHTPLVSVRLFAVSSLFSLFFLSLCRAGVRAQMFAPTSPSQQSPRMSRSRCPVQYRSERYRVAEWLCTRGEPYVRPKDMAKKTNITHKS